MSLRDKAPADHFEKVIVTSLVAFFKDHNQVLVKLNGQCAGSSEIQHLLTQTSALANRLLSADFSEQRDILQEVIDRIDLTTEEVNLSLRLDTVMARLECGAPDDKAAGSNSDVVFQLTVPVQLKRRGVETGLILGGDHPTINPDPKLIEMISRAYVWYQQLTAVTVRSIHALAEREKCDASDVSRIMPLAFLAPEIVTIILAGLQPGDLTADRLKRLSLKSPICWKRQKAVLGFADKI